LLGENTFSQDEAALGQLGSWETVTALSFSQDGIGSCGGFLAETIQVV